MKSLYKHGLQKNLAGGAYWYIIVGGLVLALIASFMIWMPVRNADADAIEITVYKSPTCGCCNKWISHLSDNGFKVKAVNMPNMDQIRARSGITSELSSCHTALVDDYIVEGHVPADVVKRLLQERPEVRGISVPGMVMGSPGMEGNRRDAYNILTFDAEGNTAVYASRR